MAVMLTMFIMLFMTAGTAGETQTDADGQWVYFQEDGSVTIIGYSTEPLKNLTIPSELGGYPVTGIEDISLFYWNDSLTDVILPDGLISIGDYMFSGCSALTHIILPDSLQSIGYEAFIGCSSLTAITIPASVVKIGAYSFVYCDNLTHIDTAPENTVYASIDGVLFDIEQKMLVAYPSGRLDTTY